MLVGGGYFAAQYLITQFTAPPPKPTFPNDKPAAKPKPAAKEEKPPVPQPSPSTSPAPTSSAPTTPAKAGYQARVKLSEGLNLRDKPSRDGGRVGGLDYNDRVTVLEETSDREWQKIRLANGDLEGWIKSGYTERVN